MNNTLVIKRYIFEFSRKPYSNVECHVYEAKGTQKITVKEEYNEITLLGFEDLFNNHQKNIKIVSDDFLYWRVENVEEHECLEYVSTIELNGNKIFDIKDCRIIWNRIESFL